MASWHREEARLLGARRSEFALQRYAQGPTYSDLQSHPVPDPDTAVKPRIILQNGAEFCRVGCGDGVVHPCVPPSLPRSRQGCPGHVCTAGDAATHLTSPLPCPNSFCRMARPRCPIAHALAYPTQAWASPARPSGCGQRIPPPQRCLSLLTGPEITKRRGQSAVRLLLGAMCRSMTWWSPLLMVAARTLSL